MDTQSPITKLFENAAQGDQNASAELLPLVYNQLRAIAAHRMNLERPDHTLQPTALVHEAFLKLVGDRNKPWAGEAHFYAAAAEAMRQILLDHARGKLREKRGGKRQRQPLDLLEVANLEDSAEILALDEAICRLEQQEPEIGQIVRLRFYAGLSVDQTAEAMNLSPRTVDRRWQFARAWLFRELTGDGSRSGEHGQ
ncbi:MAG: sigma-70 family RNA polymerase sigma factor [Planctomycetales bacterium]|nr:sigma-70 family RNA polymerase sigma factor [Planctomycetales bacterium]